VAQSGETTKQKHVPNPLKVFFRFGDHTFPQLGQFFPCQEDDFFLGVFQLGLERVEGDIAVVTFLNAPPQEPLQVVDLLFGGVVPHIDLIPQIVHVGRQPRFVDNLKREVLVEGLQMVPYGFEFFVSRVPPTVLIAALLDKLVKGGVERRFWAFCRCLSRPEKGLH